MIHPKYYEILQKEKREAFELKHFLFGHILHIARDKWTINAELQQ